MKGKLTLLFVVLIAHLSIAQETFDATTGIECQAYVDRQAVMENAPYVTESVVISVRWLYCGPWSGSNNGTIYLDIWQEGGFQQILNTSDSGNGCSWVTDTYTVSAAMWNEALASSETPGAIVFQANISDSCPGGVGCSSYSDPCFEVTTDFEYEPVEAPVANFSIEDINYCVGEEISIQDLSVGSGLTYEWDFGSDATPADSDAEGDKIVSYSSAGTKTISLTTTNIIGTSTTSLEITVNPVPELTTSGDVEVCANETPIILEATGTGDFQWSNELGTDAAVSVSPIETSVYSVSLTNEFLCSSSQDIQVTVLDVPELDAGEDQDLCQGESAVLSATGEGDISWDFDPEAGSSIEVTPTQTTVYTANTIAENGCVNTDEVLVNLNLLPQANAGDDMEICIGDEAELIASGGEIYIWDNDLGEGATQVVSPEIETSYTVTVTSTAGCSDEDEIVVFVNMLPEVQTTENTEICFGEETEISATGALTYSWDNDLGEGSSQTVSPEEETIYTVTGTDSNGCVSSAEITVTVLELPEIETSLDVSICPGESAFVAAYGAPAMNWDQGLGDGPEHEVTPIETTIYSVTGTGENGCFATAEVQVSVFKVTEPVISGLSEEPYCSDDENAYNLLGQPSGGDFSGFGVVNNQFFPAQAGIGPLEISYDYTDENGCSTSTSQLVVVEICESVKEIDGLIELYPNPVREEMVINWSALNKKAAAIEIIDVRGSIVKRAGVLDNSSSLSLNLSDLAKGNYIMKLNGDNWSVVKRFVKQ